jgi:Ca-activated chloride channel family protein
VQRLQPAQGTNPGDLFSLIVFSTEVRSLAQARPVNAAFYRVIESLLQEIDAGGQTALCGGLEMGIASAAEEAAGTRLVLLLSDGQANVGETDIEAVGRRALDARQKGITVSTLGVGLDYNEALMAEIAIDGGGRFYHIEKASQIAAYLTGELGEMASLAARDVQVSLNLPAGTGVQTLSAAYPVRGHQVTLGDIPLRTSLEVVVRLQLPAQPAGSRLSMDGVVRCQSPAGRKWEVSLNRVTVRYREEPSWVLDEGVVKPVVRRVFRQMQAAGVLATSKAAARGAAEARKKQKGELAAMTRYAALLGEDEGAAQELAESERVLGAMAAPAPGAASKRAMADATRRQRGSKNFDNV